jgi:lipopolysaccharide transport system permease protein|tara:strand:+ start:452 stop:1261 length:810 start_codon:yes stop_codon:yes gene_type:complete
MIQKLLGALTSASRNRELIGILAKREVEARYRGALMGNIWAFINPLIMLTIYTLVFKFIFKAKWANAPETDFAFSQLLFVGMIVHSLAGEVLTRSTTMILNNSNYVKKITFPLDILAWITMESALVHALISFFILCVFLIATSFPISITWLFLPMILFPFCLFLLGISWIVAAFGVYFRDLDQIMGLVVTALLFLSPVFYSVDSAPLPVQPFLQVNPLTLIIEQGRAVLIYQQLPDMSALALYYAFAFFVFILGFQIFSKLRRGFTDVM